MRSLPGKTGKEKTLKRFAVWILIPSVFILDRLSKIWVLAHLKEGEGFPVWPGFFHITRVNNTGAAFGLWRHASVFLVGVTVLSVLAIATYLALGLRKGRARNFYGWALVMGGALGNLYDRVHFGYVIDYLDFRVWPVFNAADTAICLGVFWVLWRVLRKNAPHTS